MDEARFITSLFKYKAWANDNMLEALGEFDEHLHAGERRAAIYLLNHTYIVDRIFASHLTGSEHGYTATTESVNPSLDELSVAIGTSDAWYVGYVGSLQRNGLEECIDFTFTDGKPGRMSREEILMHVLMHGTYHRGAIGRIMTERSITPPRDLLTGYLHETEAAERRR